MEGGIYFARVRVGALRGEIMAIKRRVTIDGETFEVELEKSDDCWKVSIDGSQFEVQVEQERGLAPKREARSRSSSARSGTIS